MKNYYYNSSSNVYQSVNGKVVKNESKNVNIKNNKGNYEKNNFLKNKIINKKLTKKEIKDILNNQHPRLYISNENMIKALNIINNKKL